MINIQGTQYTVIFRFFFLIASTLFIIGLLFDAVINHQHIDQTEQQQKSLIDGQFSLIEYQLNRIPLDQYDDKVMQMSQQLAMSILLLDAEDINNSHPGIVLKSHREIHTFYNAEGDVYFFKSMKGSSKLLVLGPFSLQEISENQWQQWMPILFYLCIFIVVGLWMRPMIKDLCKALQIPLYTWSFGGAAGITEHYFILSIDNQIDSYINHTRMMKNYEPNNSLFVLQFGLNDFITYDRPVGDVDTNFAQALNKLIANGVNNILVINLPDPTHAPEFKYVDEKTIEKVKRNIKAYNEYSKKRVEQHKAEGVNIVLYDFYSLLESIVVYPEMFDFKNVTDSCLKINRSDYRDYLERHKLRRDCREKGSDSYVFWGVTHPITRSHEIISQEVIRTSIDSFAIKKIR